MSNAITLQVISLTDIETKDNITIRKAECQKPDGAEVSFFTREELPIGVEMKFWITDTTSQKYPQLISATEPKKATPPPPKEEAKQQIVKDPFAKWESDLRAYFLHPDNENRVRAVLSHLSPQEATQALSRLIQHIKAKDVNDASRANLMKCSFDSVVDVIGRIAELDIPLGENRLYLIPYANVMTLSIGYLAYVYKAKQADPTIFEIQAKLVFTGQEHSTKSREIADYPTITGTGEATPGYPNV